jgi:hypothetical protein
MRHPLPLSYKVIHPNEPWYLNQTPAPSDRGRDQDPARPPSWLVWMDDPAYPVARADDEYPGATEDELLGVTSAWRRIEAKASAVACRGG